MADIKISELPAASQALLTDQIETNQGGVTKRLDCTQLFDLFNQGLPSTRVLLFRVDPNFVNRGYNVRRINSSNDFDFDFAIPDDFVSLNGVTILGWPINADSSGAGKEINLTSNYGGANENVNTNSTSSSEVYDLGGEGERFELDLSPVFPSLSAGDTCSINISQQDVGGPVAYFFIKISYEI